MSATNDPSDTSENVKELTRNLRKAIIDVKTRKAEQDDVVIEMKEAEAARLELLAEELRPLFNDIDETDERFDLGLSRGERPRMWIDMTSFVAMGHDKRSYRFLKDTRMGRIVLAETDDLDKMADLVSQYVAEKVLEREKMIEGEWISLKNAEAASTDEAAIADDPSSVSQAEPSARSNRRWGGFFWFMFGVTCCLGALVAAAFVLAPDAF